MADARRERTGLLAGGNWIIDHVKIIDRFPEQDTLASILRQSRGTGGSPYNVLVGLAKLGAPFPLQGAGLVGDDEDGRTIRAECQALGIDMRRLHTTGKARTSYTDVMTVQATGRRTFFHSRGANSLLAREHFDLEASHARIFHLGYLLLLDALDRIEPDGCTGASLLLQRARELGLRTSVDLVSEQGDRFGPVVTPSLPHTDILFVNEFEASKASGLPVHADGAVDFRLLSRAAIRLLELGVREWVIAHAPEGALALHRDGTEIVQGSVLVPPDRIAGTAGAGDAFAAGALMGIHEGWAMPDSLRLGVCAAAANLSGATCTESILPRAACLALGETYGYRGIP